MMARQGSRPIKLEKASTKGVSLEYLGQKTRNVLSQQVLIRLSSFGTWRQGGLFRLGDLEKEPSVFQITKLVLFGLLREVTEWS